MHRIINDTSRAVGLLSLYLCLQPWLLLCLLRLTTKASLTFHHPPGRTTCKFTLMLIPLERLRWGSSRCISLWWCRLAGIIEAVEPYLECKQLSTKSTVTQPSYRVTSCTTLWQTPRFVIATSCVATATCMHTVKWTMTLTNIYLTTFVASLPWPCNHGSSRAR